MGVLAKITVNVEPLICGASLGLLFKQYVWLRVWQQNKPFIVLHNKRHYGQNMDIISAAFLSNIIHLGNPTSLCSSSDMILSKDFMTLEFLFLSFLFTPSNLALLLPWLCLV